MFNGGTIAVPDSIMSFAVQDFTTGTGTRTHVVTGARDTMKNIALSGKLPVGRMSFNGLPFLQAFSVGANPSPAGISYIITAVISQPLGSLAVSIGSEPANPDTIVVVVSGV